MTGRCPRSCPGGRVLDPDAGIATVWAAAGITMIVGVLVFGLQLGAAVTARHRAEAAADLAALAAAGLTVHGQQVACDRAGRVATEMGTTLLDCALRGWEALVTVRVEHPFLQFSGRSAVGRARAGPDTGVTQPRTDAPSGRLAWPDGKRHATPG